MPSFDEVQQQLELLQQGQRCFIHTLNEDGKFSQKKALLKSLDPRLREIALMNDKQTKEIIRVASADVKGVIFGCYTPVFDKRSRKDKLDRPAYHCLSVVLDGLVVDLSFKSEEDCQLWVLTMYSRVPACKSAGLGPGSFHW